MSVTDAATNKRDAYSPFQEIVTVTPSDSVPFSPPLRGVICTVAGNVAIKTEKNQTAVTVAMLQGQLLPAMITHVMSTNTTGTVVGGR